MLSLFHSTTKVCSFVCNDTKIIPTKWKKNIHKTLNTTTYHTVMVCVCVCVCGNISSRLLFSFSIQCTQHLPQQHFFSSLSHPKFDCCCSFFDRRKICEKCYNIKFLIQATGASSIFSALFFGRVCFSFFRQKSMAFQLPNWKCRLVYIFTWLNQWCQHILDMHANILLFLFLILL